MIKFGRQYRLTVETDALITATKLDAQGNPIDGSTTTSGGSNSVVITMPTTIVFNVDRSVSSNVNTCSIQIYNLPKNIREQIFHDSNSTLNYKKVVLEIGYDSLSLVFQGNINRAYSARNGPDIITYIHSFDGGFDTINTKTSVTLDGADTNKIQKTLINEFTHLTEGVIGVATEDINRPVVLEGNTWELLKTYTNSQCFVDAEKVHILGDNQVFEGSVPVIDSSSSILQTPQREAAYVTVITLLEPGFVLGQIVKLSSVIQSEYDGQYKIIGISHNGTISGAIGGACQSVVNLINQAKFSKGFVMVKSGGQ